VKAFENGAKFDGWSEYFNIDIWRKAFEECNIDGGFYALRDRDYSEVMPWDFIDAGVNKEFLMKENEKAKNAEVTPDCRQGCRNCGINVNLKGKCFEGAISD
jgi:hypothetical protein